MKTRGFLAAALLCACCAAALADEKDMMTPRTGFAVVAGEETAMVEITPMFDRADEALTLEDAVMYYVDGTAVEVLELLEGGMTRVRVGTPDAFAEGYMHADALRYGTMAMREAAHGYYLQQVGAQPAYSGLGEDAAVIGKTDPLMTCLICGFSPDGRVQLAERGQQLRGGWQDGIQRGFVRVEEMAGELMQPDQYIVRPVEGELSYEQAYERAVAHALENPQLLAYLTDAQKTEEGLRAMWSDVRLVYNRVTGEAEWQVVFQQDGENHDQNAMINMTPEGVLKEVEHGNG